MKNTKPTSKVPIIVSSVAVALSLVTLIRDLASLRVSRRNKVEKERQLLEHQLLERLDSRVREIINIRFEQMEDKQRLEKLKRASASLHEVNL